MRIKLAIPDRHATADVLNAVLEATSRANHSMIAAGESPTATELISRGAKWKPEPYMDGEHFDLGDVMARPRWGVKGGAGDCDDWAPLLAGELRATGEDPGAVSVVERSGPGRWHAVVRTSDGRRLDPSAWAGMKSKRDSGVMGAITRPMCVIGDGGMAVQRDGRRWAARCDLPWPGSDAHIASMARASSPEAALHRAVVGALYCGEGMEFPHAALAEQICGELVGEVGSLFGDIASVAKAAIPIAANVMAPGSGALLSSLTQGGGGDGGAPAPGAPAGAPGGMRTHQLPGGAGTVAYSPYGPGPVIVRF